MKHISATEIPEYPNVIVDYDFDAVLTRISDTKTANTTIFTISHGLGRIPSNVNIVRKNSTCDCYILLQNNVEQISDISVSVKFTANNANVILRIF